MNRIVIGMMMTAAAILVVRAALWLKVFTIVWQEAPPDIGVRTPLLILMGVILSIIAGVGIFLFFKYRRGANDGTH